MWLVKSIGILVLFMSMICLTSYGIINLVLLLSKKIRILQKAIDKISRLNQTRRKFILVLLLLIISGLGIYQALVYYLASGAYFWFVIFTMGLLLLLYIAPLGSIFMPLVKKEYKNWNRFSIIYWNFVCSTSWMWGLLLIIDRSTIIYEDEGGVNFHYGSSSLKVLRGVCLVIIAVYLTLSLASKKSEVNTL